VSVLFARTWDAAVAVEALHRISPEEYRRLVEAEVFDEDARIELIDGLLVDMSPKTRAHENAVAWLTRYLVLNVDAERYEVRVRAPLTIGSSEPEADVAVIPESAPRPHHPATAAAVIEVVVSSLTRDLTDKPPIYAPAGVPIYWAVDLERHCAVMHSTPANGRYTKVDVVPADGELLAPELGLRIALPELFAAAAR
jgi:Uma2 family endonuclease